MYDRLLGIEFSILDFLQGLHSEWADCIMLFFTRLGDGGLVWISAALLLLVKKESRKAGICMLSALLINFIITNITLKPLVERIRPFDIRADITLLISPPGDFSFPSGHTASSFAAATAAFLCNRKMGTVMYVLASLIAFSRLYLYVHFLTDVICAALIGAGVGFASVKTYDAFSNRSV